MNVRFLSNQSYYGTICEITSEGFFKGDKITGTKYKYRKIQNKSIQGFQFLMDNFKESKRIMKYDRM